MLYRGCWLGPALFVVRNLILNMFKTALIFLTVVFFSPLAAADEKAIPPLKDGEASDPAKVITTASGLKYRVLQLGVGRGAPEIDDRVTVHYSGKLPDGTEFDNTRKRGQPISFPLSTVIEGWTEGLQLMTEGAKYQFIVPPELAYGEKGVSGIVGPQATLVFDVELLKVESDLVGAK